MTFQNLTYIGDWNKECKNKEPSEKLEEESPSEILHVVKDATIDNPVNIAICHYTLLFLVPELVKWFKEKKDKSSRIAFAIDEFHRLGKSINEIVPQLYEMKENIKVVFASATTPRKLIKKKEDKRGGANNEAILEVEKQLKKPSVRISMPDGKRMGYIVDLKIDCVFGSEEEEEDLVLAQREDEEEAREEEEPELGEERITFCNGLQDTGEFVQHDTSKLSISQVAKTCAGWIVLHKNKTCAIFVGLIDYAEELALVQAELDRLCGGKSIVVDIHLVSTPSEHEDRMAMFKEGTFLPEEDGKNKRDKKDKERKPGNWEYRVAVSINQMKEGFKYAATDACIVLESSQAHRHPVPDRWKVHAGAHRQEDGVRQD